MNSYGMNTQEGRLDVPGTRRVRPDPRDRAQGRGIGRDPIAFNWCVGGNGPAVGDGVCCTLQCSNATCPAVVIWEG